MDVPKKYVLFYLNGSFMTEFKLPPCKLKVNNY